MFDHDTIWNAIDRLANARGLSASGLAKQAGLDPTTFNPSKRVSAEGKLRWPSTESLSKILFVTQTSMAEFLLLMDDEKNHETQGPTLPHISDDDLNKRGWPDMMRTERMALLPENGRHSLMIEITSSLFLPEYPKGRMLILSRTDSFRRGDPLYIRLKKGKAVAGLFHKATTENMMVQSFDGESTHDCIKKNIDFCARIVWASF